MKEERESPLSARGGGIERERESSSSGRALLYLFSFSPIFYVYILSVSLNQCNRLEDENNQILAIMYVHRYLVYLLSKNTTNKSSQVIQHIMYANISSNIVLYSLLFSILENTLNKTYPLCPAVLSTCVRTCTVSHDKF